MSSPSSSSSSSLSSSSSITSSPPRTASLLVCALWLSSYAQLASSQTAVPSLAATNAPTVHPSGPSAEPSHRPSYKPIPQRISWPPTQAPSISFTPTTTLSPAATGAPSAPSYRPSFKPHSRYPTRHPSKSPSYRSARPITKAPTFSPDYTRPPNYTPPPTAPSPEPTAAPSKTRYPSLPPQYTRRPSKSPSYTYRPTSEPSISKSPSWTAAPSRPTVAPSAPPSVAPTVRPTRRPSRQPTAIPTITFRPTAAPSISFSPAYTVPPTRPTVRPTRKPTKLPTLAPNATPRPTVSTQPTSSPTAVAKTEIVIVFAQTLVNVDYTLFTSRALGGQALALAVAQSIASRRLRFSVANVLLPMNFSAITPPPLSAAVGAAPAVDASVAAGEGARLLQGGNPVVGQALPLSVAPTAAPSPRAIPQTLAVYAVSCFAEDVGGYKNVSRGITNVVAALTASTVGVNGAPPAFVTFVKAAAKQVKTFGLSTITGTSVRVYRKPTVIVVRSTAPTAAPTGRAAPAAGLAKSNQQFLFTLPQQGYIWFPITIFFGGLFCFVLPCWYCGCGPAVFRTVKKAFRKGPPALDEEEGPRVPKGGFQPMDAVEQPISISGLQQEAAKKSLGILGGGGSPRKGRYALLGQREEKEPDERL